MEINWSEVGKSVATNVITAILVGAIGAFVLFKITFDNHDRRIRELETRPFVTSPGAVSGLSGKAEVPIIVSKGEEAVVLISANASGTAEGKQFRSEIVVMIEVDSNVVARELIWIPQYAYDPAAASSAPGLNEEQAKALRNFPRVATPVSRLERMETIELSTSASALVELKEGNHSIRAICDGEDLTSRQVHLSYVVIQNSGKTHLQ